MALPWPLPALAFGFGGSPDDDADVEAFASTALALGGFKNPVEESKEFTTSLNCSSVGLSSVLATPNLERDVKP